MCHPPQWPVKILRFFVKKEYLEEIEGDMEEIFQDNVARFSIRKAKRIYTWEMVKLLRPSLVKNLSAIQHINQYAMFNNYFKISIRGLMKNPLNSFINIFGLSAAIGICILLYAFAQYTFRTDQFHENKNVVYLATFFANRDGTEQQYGITPRPLGEMLKEDFAQVKKMCRIQNRDVVVKQEANVFHERISYTDPAFLEMFTFPLKWGISGSLNDVNSIILSEEMSIKYFGDENPIGQNIQLNFEKERTKVFKVTGVAKKFPESRSFGFSFLLHFDNLKFAEPDYDFQDWREPVNATFIQVGQPSDIVAIAARMGKYKTIQNRAIKNDWAISSFVFEPLVTLHQHAENMKEDITGSSASDYKSIIFLSVISLFMMALACFNYINIAIVSAAKRLKEIGVRKSIGASRKTVIVQFLSENIVITFFALIMGVLLGRFVIIPWFEQMNYFSTEFTFNDRTLWMYLLAILLFTAIASGIYPAFYISRFQVVNILKGSVQFGKKNPITKIFLTFQLILACILMTSAVMFTQNSAYMVKRPWGYNKAEAIYAAVPDQLAYDQLGAVMAQDPNVISISGSKHHIAKSNTTAVVHLPEREYEVDQLSVDAHYFETLGIDLAAGRIFNKQENGDKQAIIVNEFLVKNLSQLLPGWEQPIGQQVEIDSMRFEVVGVVKDFHSSNFFKPIRPLIFKVANKEDYRYLSLKAAEGTEIKTYKALQAEWAKLYPQIPFQGSLQEDVWGDYYSQMSTHGKFWRGIALIAVLLASLGLYGLMTLNVTGRVKEFSIRKVMGANTKNIALNVTKQYWILFIAALVIGAPISFVLLKFVLEFAYEYHMPIDYSGTIIAVALLIVVVLTTVSLQIRKVSKSNPVEGLKME